MAELKRWFKRLWCRLFDCSLADENIECRYEERTRMYQLRNRCVRCGMEYKCELSEKDLLNHKPIRRRDYNG